jgi:site-specific DNA recombinase
MPKVEVGSLAAALEGGTAVRVAIYRRISTDEERQPFSLDAQQERLTAYVAAQPGWALTRSYSDRMSGKRLDRPGLQQALHDARTGRYDLLLVFKVDRLARSTGGLAKVLEELDTGGVAFRSASEPFDTSTAAGRMMMQMLGVFAEFEREMIVERTRMGLARKAARGEWTGGTPPFGYRYDAEARTLIPVPMQAALVQRIFMLYVDRRLGSATISGQLNDSGQLTSRGHRWTPNRILGVLRNPTYLGQLPFNGERHQAAHEPIIDRELFERAQLLLAERSDSASAQAANATDYLLTSFLRCQRCGHGFVGTTAHGNGGVYRYYTCFSRQRHGTARCDQERLPAGPLEKAIVAETLAALDDGSIFEAAAVRAQQAWHAQHPGRQAELSGARAALGERRAAIGRYLRAFEVGGLPESTCADRLAEVEQEVRALEVRTAVLKAECETTPVMATGEVLVGVRRRVECAVADAAPGLLKRLLGTVVEQILVESRACIEPYFVAPAVRTRPGSRRRTGIEPA